MSIRFKTIITYRDEIEEIFDCYEHPQQSNEYWVLSETSEKRKYIPKEAIMSVEVKDYWKKD